MKHACASLRAITNIVTQSCRTIWMVTRVCPEYQLPSFTLFVHTIQSLTLLAAETIETLNLISRKCISKVLISHFQSNDNCI